MCTCSALFWLKAFSQTVGGGTSHPGPSLGLPVWMRLWRSSWLGLAKAFSHVSHLNTRGAHTLPHPKRGTGTSVLSWRGRTLRCVARLKAFLHTGQTWMRSRPWAALLCCSSWPAEVKLQPHSRHTCSRASFSGAPPGPRLVETSVTCNRAESQPNC
uniref:Secreted protein n=1 Tax=Moschus moschiferus TaxID=68415 RepID=A0A8C6DAJ7_MOSMO